MAGTQATQFFKMFSNLTAKKALSKREKALTVTFLFLLAFSLYYSMILEKQVQRIKSLKAQVSQRDMIFKDMRQKNISDISDMENKMKEYDKMIAGIYDLAPNIKDTPGIIVDFQRLLTTNRLTSDNLSFSQLTPHGDYSTFTLGLKVKGAAANVQNFLKSVEKYKRAVNINKLNFNPTESGMLEADVELTVYVLHDIVPDPVDYPFMGGQNGAKNPFELFEYPKAKAAEGGSVIPAGKAADSWNSLFNGKPGGVSTPPPRPPALNPPQTPAAGTQPAPAKPQGQAP